MNLNITWLVVTFFLVFFPGSQVLALFLDAVPLINLIWKKKLIISPKFHKHSSHTQTQKILSHATQILVLRRHRNHDTTRNLTIYLSILLDHLKNHYKKKHLPYFFNCLYLITPTGERYVYKFVCDPEALFSMAAPARPRSPARYDVLSSLYGGVYPQYLPQGDYQRRYYQHVNQTGHFDS